MFTLYPSGEPSGAGASPQRRGEEALDVTPHGLWILRFWFLYFNQEYLDALGMLTNGEPDAGASERC